MPTQIVPKPAILFPILHPFYQLSVKETNSTWFIEMTVATPCINTKALPETFRILSEHLPSIFHCDCYNEENTPFREELRHTELGHLFEHMLLEYLCMEKLDSGDVTAEFTGRTSWNWVLESRGKFHITIGKADNDAPYFIQAIKKTISLLNLILYSSSDVSVNVSVH